MKRIKNEKNKKILVLGVVMLMLLVVGCGTPKKEQVKNNIRDILIDSYLPKNDKIESIDITNKTEYKDMGTLVYNATVVTSSDLMRTTAYYEITYIKEDKDWIVKDIAGDSSKIRETIPLRGVNDMEIRNFFNEAVPVEIEGSRWDIAYSTLKDTSIIEHNTDLDSKEDTVKVLVKSEGKVEAVEGTFEIKCKFDTDKWVRESIVPVGDFSVSVLHGKELTITGEKLSADLEAVGRMFNYGTQQGITIKAGEISDLEITEQNSSNRGEEITAKGRGKLIKNHATFDFQFEVTYKMENEWKMQDFEVIESDCIEADLKGTWGGEMLNEACTLEITSQDGTRLEGIYTYYEQVGSYYVSGNLDLKTLSIYLEAGEEIKVGRNLFGIAYGTSDIQGIYYVDEDMISGQARRGFEVHR